MRKHLISPRGRARARVLIKQLLPNGKKNNDGLNSSDVNLEPEIICSTKKHLSITLL